MMMKREDAVKWLHEVLPYHERLTESLIPLIDGLLKQNNIEFLSVTGRTKDAKSAVEKVRRKNYLTPQTKMTDLTGIRIITFFDSNVQQISEIIKSSFETDDKNSLDRSELLGNDKLGYRSVHFVCTLGKKRSQLPEFKNLGNLKFEIQARTVLQHAWAELAHDRAYKFPGVLPSALQRKLNLYSGMLEIADSAFDEIVLQISKYKDEILSGDMDQALDTPIDSINVKKYTDKYAEKRGIKLKGDVDALAIKELSDFGINTIGDFISMMNENPDTVFLNEDSYYYLGTLRDAMMLSDIEKYFKKSWQGHWNGCDNKAFERLTKKHAKEKIERIFKKNKISLYDDDDINIDDLDLEDFDISEDEFDEDIS